MLKDTKTDLNICRNYIAENMKTCSPASAKLGYQDFIKQSEDAMSPNFPKWHYKIAELQGFKLAVFYLF